MDMEREHSDRARYVTEQVALWIVNDGDHVDEARANAEAERGGAYRGLEQFCTRVISLARKGEAAWHVGQEMAPNDWARIRWDDVANQLLD